MPVPMKILHFSDLHVWRLSFDWSDPALKRFLGVANLALRRGRAFPPDLSQRVIDEIVRTEADLVVFSGDLTTTALASEFRAARERLEPIRQKWGERFFLIPGNHDRYTPRTLERSVFETHFDYALYDDPSRPVRSMALDDGVAVVGFDASVPRTIESTGLFSPSLAEALDAELERQEREGRRVVLVGHFPYAAPASVRIRRGHRLVGAERLAEVISRRKPVLYLHGHKHRRWAFRPDETPATWCVNAGSAGLATRDWSTRAGFVEIDLRQDRGQTLRVAARVPPLTVSPPIAQGEGTERVQFDSHLMAGERRD